MKCDIILSGVGGQGVLSVAAIIALAAADEGLEVRQSEVHGMAQRGGAVLAHLRIAGIPETKTLNENTQRGKLIASDLVPKGSADMILSMEPMESLRYTEWLSPLGVIISAAEPFINIPNYPEITGIIDSIKSFPKYRIIEAASLAKEAGLPRSVNMVMVGAASNFLPVHTDTLEKIIKETFIRKDKSVADANLKAFALGRNTEK